LAVALATRRDRLQAIVLSPQRTGVAGMEISFRVDGRSLRASECGAGCYVATLAGRPRRVEVELADGGYPRSTVRFRLPSSRRPATALVRRATSVFRRS